MPATPIPCPERNVLASFLVGRMPEADADALERHLGECAKCGDTIHSLNVEDTFVGLARAANGAGAEAEIPEREVVEKLIAKLQALAPAAGDSRDGGTETSPTLQQRAEEVLRLLHGPQNEGELGRLGNYRILKLLGAGGMGVVFQAEDQQLKRLVALKVLRPSLGAGARERFLREARAAAAIDHDNVITMYQVGEDGPLAFLAMPWLEGETLEDRLKREGRFSAADTLAIGRQIAEGLAAAHARKLIHRDVKPANIWLEADRRRVKILDFGLARILDEDAQLTETGMIGGTPAYMSPEQAQGESVDARSDLFSLGSVLYRMCTGELPFQAANTLAMLRAIQRDEPPPPSRANPDVPGAVSDLVMHLLEKEPSRRMGSAAAVVEAMGRIERGETHVPRSERVKLALGRHRLQLAVGVAIALLIAAFADFAGPQIIRIATNRGQLVIKTDDPDVKVEVRGETVRIIDLRTERTIDLKAGAYEIKLTDAAGGLTLSTDKFTLTRGGKAVVEVLHAPASAVSSPKTPPDAATAEPKYDGQTLGQWLAELQTERKPERLADAMRAFGTLVADVPEPAAVSAIFRLMRIHGSDVIDRSPRGELINASQQALWRMPPETVVPAMIQEMKHGNANSRAFMVWIISGPSFEETSFDAAQRERRTRRFSAEMKKRAGEITSLTLELSRDDDPYTRDWAVDFLLKVCHVLKIDPTSVDGLVQRLQEELPSKDSAKTARIAPVLVKAAPDSKGLVESLVQSLAEVEPRGTDRTADRVLMVRLLGELGLRAAPATKQLTKTLVDALEGRIPRLSRDVVAGGLQTSDIRMEIIKTLGSIGSGAKEALLTLDEITRGRESKFRSPLPLSSEDASQLAAAAKEAIAKITAEPKK
jgi:hypothetical protein